MTLQSSHCIHHIAIKPHMKKHRSSKSIKCEKCEKTFDEEWKMRAHLKNHREHVCETCDKSFKYQDILEKHISITHEDAKLYCHFFNNETTCPFEKDCVFLHENSSQCNYGALCERNLCMYKHLKNSHDEQLDGVEEDEVIDVSELNEETDIPDNEKTFFNPYREAAASRINENEESLVDLVENKNEEIEAEEFKCELCIFKTTDKKRFTKHQKEIHSVKGKYVCTMCERPFDSRKEFNGHKYHGCGGM